MARIRPFRGWRYAPRFAQDLSQVFSPLFDVVSQEQLEALYQLPFNSIHLSVPRSQNATLQKLQEWKSEGILEQDPIPAIYIYYQYFSLYGESKGFVRKGFVSLIHLDEKTGTPDGDIVLHEGTISASVKERRELLAKTLLNTAPTHGLYEDPDFQLEALMDSYMERPLYEYVDYQGVVNRIALVQDRRDLQQFQSVLAERKVYLADGHHRLASSAALLEQDPKPDSDSLRRYHLMYLSNMCGDDLRILPIHRLLRLPETTHNPNPILERLANWFDFEDVTFGRRPLYERIREEPHRFGMVLGSLQFMLTLKEEFRTDPLPLNLPPAVQRLHYTRLHYYIFDRVFGIAYAEQHNSSAISYVKDQGLAVKEAALYRDRIAFITPETTLEQMMDVCHSGALMPQKSTYFYPKVVCGPVFASIDDHENQHPIDLSFGLPAETESAP